MHLTKQDFSFKDAKREKVKSLRETNLFSIPSVIMQQWSYGYGTGEPKSSYKSK